MTYEEAWPAALRKAKAMYAHGMSTFAVESALSYVKAMYEKAKEEKAEKKKAEEEISWKKWEDLMDKAEEMWDREESYEAVHNALEAAKAMYKKVIEKERAEKEAKVKRDKAMTEEKKAKEAKQKLMDIIDEKHSRGVTATIEFSKLFLIYEAERYRKKWAKEAEEKKVVEPTFEETGKTIGQLVDKKNAKYGDSFSKSGGVLKILYPDGIKIDQYDDVLTVCRILDKLFRVATDKDALGESPYTDIAGYCILAVAKNSAERCVAANEK